MTAATVVVPAYNEADRVGDVIAALPGDRTLVVDDGSTDGTAAVAREEGARVIEHGENRGYVAALRTGFRAAEGDVLVTIDADGEHRPRDVERLVAPVREGDYDLVFGARDRLARPSEYPLNWLARRRVDVPDTTTGFRALDADLAARLDLDAPCTCGTLALEAADLGARLGSVPVGIAPVEKRRGIAWHHVRQFGALLRRLA
ncbi:MAG: glycosyltransferase family 2 protein [Halobacteriales archaeon]